MLRIRFLLGVVGLAFVGQSWAAPLPVKTPPWSVAGGTVTFRYRVPVVEKRELKTTAPKWGLAAPVVGDVSDPTLIVYDQAHLKKYIRWAIDSPIKCGAASYEVVTPKGVTKFAGGLDERYLGRRFRAEHLVRFLNHRLEGKTQIRSIRVDDPNLAKLLTKQNSTISRRLLLSPWERDLRTAITLLSHSKHAPAYPPMKALLKDRDPTIQQAALWGLGYLAPVAPKAIDDIVSLLPHKELGSSAASALTLAGSAGKKALIAALDHEDELARNRALFALARTPADDLLFEGIVHALDHKRADVREWSLQVALDMQSRGVPMARNDVIDVIAKRLLDGSDRTRYRAAVFLSELKSKAARAKPALTQAAEKDSSRRVRELAIKALSAIAEGP